jgi:hypothetical protein
VRYRENAGPLFVVDKLPPRVLLRLDRAEIVEPRADRANITECDLLGPAVRPSAHDGADFNPDPRRREPIADAAYRPVEPISRE